MQQFRELSQIVQGNQFIVATHVPAANKDLRQARCIELGLKLAMCMVTQVDAYLHVLHVLLIEELFRFHTRNTIVGGEDDHVC